MIIGWYRYSQGHRTGSDHIPIAAYMIPSDLKPRELVFVEDIIEIVVSSVNISQGGVSAHRSATAVWTGATGNAATENRMIVWGGWPVTNAGGIYNPKTNTWSAITTVGAPSARRWHTATWTGSKMVVYGGINGSSAFQNDGGIYDPLTDTWTTIPTSTGFGMQSMVSFWIGSTVGLVHWNEIRFLDPSTLTWTTYPNMNGVKGIVRYGAGFWTGSNFIMWGGEGILGEGSIFYP
jgi:hypothetical protein